MSKFNFRLLIASITFAVGILGATLWYNNYCRYSVKDVDQNATSSEVRGFDEVTSAADGTFVTTYGWVDPKSLCEEVPKDQSAFCNTYLTKDPSEYIKVQLKFCGEHTTSNCIDLENSDVSRGSIKIYDANAKLIDGMHQVKATGRITIKDEIGRFAAPVERISSIDDKGENVVPLSKIDLTQIGRINFKGRVQDIDYNELKAVDDLIAHGNDSIPFLIGKLTDETKVKGHSIDYRNDTKVGDVAFIILTDFFTDGSWKNSTVKDISLNDLAGCSDLDTTPKACFDIYLKTYGREHINQLRGKKYLQAKWQKIWKENSDKIYWNNSERCFRLKD